MRTSRYHLGFTLIELLVVISIIGLLATLVIVQLHGKRAEARDAKRLADARTLMTAFELYYNDYQKFPQVFLHSWTMCAWKLDNEGESCSTRFYNILFDEGISDYMSPFPVQDPLGGDFYRYIYVNNFDDSPVTNVGSAIYFKLETRQDYRQCDIPPPSYVELEEWSNMCVTVN